MRTAFLLGAGLGTRLLPLTALRPKPLIPLWNKPLATFAMDHLIASGCERFLINTHHCPQEWHRLFSTPSASYRNCPIHFRHEPTLLETGGGLKNMEDLAGGEPLLVYNGDILADFPLAPAIWRHQEAGNIATLLLRSSGGPLQVQWNSQTGQIEDIRRSLGTSNANAYLFTGVYLVSPEIFAWLPPGERLSIVPVLLSLIRAGRKVGGHLVDEGVWLDLGKRDAYLSAHQLLKERQLTLSYSLDSPLRPVAEGVDLPASTKVEGFVSIGPGCRIGENVTLKDSVLWENVSVAAGSSLQRCVVRSGAGISGCRTDLDI